MPRIPVPDDVAATVLFYSDRTCCVCRIPKKPLQIHHIDDNNSHNALENLAVLCLDCHTETQISGGFGRKLDAPQVKLYRDEWLEKIGRYSTERKPVSDLDSTSAPFIVDAGAGDSTKKHERVESTLKKLEARERLFELVFEYDHSDQIDRRDKCIDKILLDKDVPVQEEIYLRSMQGKVHLIDATKLEKELDHLKKEEDWSSLARACRQLGRLDEAVEYYCLTCIKGLKEANPFLAGFYLKEMVDENLIAHLFERALQQAITQDDVWWQIRSLQELGRNDEIDELVLGNRGLIEQRGRPHELDLLKSALKRQRRKS